MSQSPRTSTISGKAVGHIGFGLMAEATPARPHPALAPTEYPAAVEVMKTALQRGANFWNGGMFYGPPDANSLQLLKYYFTTYPEDAEKVVLSIKGAYERATNTPTGSPEGVRASVDEALRVLDGVKTIDVFQCARVDPSVPIETTVRALAELVTEGKIGGIGLSEVTAATIRRAHAVHPIAAVEVELSLFTTGPLTDGVAETCRELGITLVAYSPLSRGFLTGRFRKFDDLPQNDFRRMMPRFQPEVFGENFKLVEAVEAISKRKGATVGQVAIAWVRQQGGLPIPGATTVVRVEENCADVKLGEEDMAEIQKYLDALPILGHRYPPGHTKLLSQ